MRKPRSDPGLNAVIRVARVPAPTDLYPEREVKGFPAVAQIVGCTLQWVCAWKRIPAHFVIPLETATGVHRSIQRPDLYPPERPRRSRARASAA